MATQLISLIPVGEVLEFPLFVNKKHGQTSIIYNGTGFPIIVDAKHKVSSAEHDIHIEFYST